MLTKGFQISFITTGFRVDDYEATITTLPGGRSRIYHPSETNDITALFHLDVASVATDCGDCVLNIEVGDRAGIRFTAQSNHFNIWSTPFPPSLPLLE